MNCARPGLWGGRLGNHWLYPEAQHAEALGPYAFDIMRRAMVGCYHLEDTCPLKAMDNDISLERQAGWPGGQEGRCRLCVIDHSASIEVTQ